jgi:hypothetical protein
MRKVGEPESYIDGLGKVKKEVEEITGIRVVDNWVHRSENMQCDKCMHFNNNRCRRHAPTMQGFPAVYPTDWCGDHKLDKEEMDK